MKGRERKDITMNDHRDKQRQDTATIGLTPMQLRIRERCGKVPKHLRRSVDRYRVALGRPPLWGGLQEQRR
jgi:hypothetical protein